MNNLSIPLLQHCNPTLATYIIEEIIPRYAKFDKAHQEDHAWKVITGSLELAQKYNTDYDMSLIIAAFHDTGLIQGRDLHHIHSGEILKADTTINQWFTAEQIELMTQAIEDHRASNKHEPRSIYGKIVAEADRIIDSDITLRRTVLYGLKHLPNGTMDEQYQRFKKHLIEKYGDNGYLKLWLSLPTNEAELKKIREMIRDEQSLYAAFLVIYNQEVNK